MVALHKQASSKQIKERNDGKEEWQQETQQEVTPENYWAHIV